MKSNLISWIFCIVFIVIGVLNLLLVHPVPGIFYLILSIIYFPFVNVALKKRFGFYIPLVVKVILGIVILWATLAVGDLAEMFGL
jgi:hypothetical protein